MADIKGITSKTADLVYDLGATAQKFAELSEVQENQKTQLTYELGLAREEIDNLQRKLAKVERKNLKLKQLVLVNQNWEEKRSGTHPQGQPKDDHGKDVNKRDRKKHPFAIFPEEVWSMIFGYLKEPKDFKNCYDTCTAFRDMLQAQTKIFLLADVLPIVAQHVPGFVISREYPYPYERASSALGNCRLVCRGWRLSVDHFLQSDSDFFAHPPGKEGMSPSPRSKFAMNFRLMNNPWSNSEIRTMSAEINPIVSRFLVYNDATSFFCVRNAGKEALRHSLSSYLEKFGSHVWFFQVNFRDDYQMIWSTTREELTSWYNLLRTWLPLMPNLKELYLKNPLHKWFHDDKRDYGSRSNKSMLQWLSEDIVQHSFPTVSTLKKVVFDDCPPSLMEVVLTANPQIEKLGISRCPDNQVNFNMNSINLTKLYEFSLVHRGDSVDDFENVSWNLRKLTLEAKCIRDWQDLSHSIACCFGETLIELNMTLVGPCHESAPRLDLPNLKVMNLKLSRCFNSIDFVLPLESLEYLSVDLTGMNQVESKYSFDKDKEYKPLEEIVETINFHQHIHELECSNIWQLLPKLRKVKVRTDHKWGSDGSTEMSQPVNYNKWHYCTRDQLE